MIAVIFHCLIIFSPSAIYFCSSAFICKHPVLLSPKSPVVSLHFLVNLLNTLIRVQNREVVSGVIKERIFLLEGQSVTNGQRFILLNRAREF